MGLKEKVFSTIHTIEGKKENVETIMNAIEQFFENLEVEVEDWKVSTEEFHEGTRIFVRLQIIVKRKEAAHER